MQSIDWIFPLGNISPLIKHSSGALLLSFLLSAPGKPGAAFIWEMGIWVNSPSRTILYYCDFQSQIFSELCKEMDLQSVNRDFRARKALFFFLAGTSCKYWPSLFHILPFPCQIPPVSSAKTPWPCCGSATTIKGGGKFSTLLGQDYFGGSQELVGRGKWRMKWQLDAGRAWCTVPGAGQLRAGSPDTHLHLIDAGLFLAAALGISRTDP